VLVRFSDFTSAQYGTLLGARQFEPKEGNPALGLRGASRYYRNLYRDGFVLECKAIRRVRETFGLTNVALAIPHARTPGEVRRILQIMGQHGLQRGADGLEVHLMVQLPVNALLAADFAQVVDGFCISPEDLAQTVLGLDREEAPLLDLFEPAGEALRGLIAWTVSAARQAGIRVGVVGETAGTDPDFTRFLVDQGVDYLAVNPESLLTVKQRVLEAEQRSQAR
jgi:pyruvate,water dikinase